MIDWDKITYGNKELKELQHSFIWQRSEPGCCPEIDAIIYDWQGGKCSTSQTVARLEDSNEPKVERLLSAIFAWKSVQP